MLPYNTNYMFSSGTWFSNSYHEHRSYSRLRDFQFIHRTVCHQNNFVDKLTLVNTQDGESFHNELKLGIKKQKKVHISKKLQFLNSFCFYFNNRACHFYAKLNLIINKF